MNLVPLGLPTGTGSSADYERAMCSVYVRAALERAAIRRITRRST